MNDVTFFLISYWEKKKGCHIKKYIEFFFNTLFKNKTQKIIFLRNKNLLHT